MSKRPSRPHRTPGLPTLLAFIALACLVLSPAPAASGRKAARTPRPGDASRWIRIDYDNLVDRSAPTRSDMDLGALLSKTAPRGVLSKGARAELQPFLEPFSFICYEIVVAASGPQEEKLLSSIANDYPPGSRQPAWAALFREGHYQLFVGDGRARLFLKGENPKALFRQHHGVVRHPLLKALEKSGTEQILLEVYAFRNDYGTRTLSLDPVPYTTTITPRDCAPRARELPLEGLSDFFARGPALEAAEIDDNGDFYLYGRHGGGEQTVAGRQITLEDFAVIYRAVSHHGQNPPFISLDPSEDNRYVKVNFGGFLEDTAAGSVLLDADRLFKTMMSGIDPDKLVPNAETIRRVVPDFRSVDERSLFGERPEDGRARFWFYPDRISTVTDGRIGVVKSYRFLADEERTDGKGRKHRAGREVVDHLNRNFDRYAQAFPPYKELDTVGRLMAISKWLRSADNRRRIDLDALLSVELSPRKTPRRNRKILAVTDGVRITDGTSFREHRKTRCLDEVIGQGDPTTGDPAFLKRAREDAQRVGIKDLLPEGTMKSHPNGFSRSYSASIGGGVEMNPSALAAPQRSPGSPLIARIRESRTRAGSASADGGELIRSSMRGSGSTAPGREKKALERAKPPRAPENGPAAPTPAKKPHGATRPHLPVPEAEIMMKESVVKSPAYPAEIILTGNPSPGGTIILRKGNVVAPSPDR
jgi:hypothetical protein